MFHHYRQNRADNLKAQEYFRRALVRDSQSPQATAALSIALTIAAYLSWADNPERTFTEAFELGERAVAQDARYPNAHFALALIACGQAEPNAQLPNLRTQLHSTRALPPRTQCSDLYL